MRGVSHARHRKMLEVVIGEVQWRNQLPWEVVLAHVTIAAAVWGIGVSIAWRLARPIVSGTDG